MLDKLKKIIRNDLPRLLDDIACWKSLVLNKYKPVIHRAYTMVGSDTLCLHRLDYFGAKGKSLRHPHPWPAAFYIVQGRYLMNIGVTPDREVYYPPAVATFEMGEGSFYDMTSPLVWHAIEPIDDNTYSIMLNGPDWSEEEVHKAVIKHREPDEVHPEMDWPALVEHLDVFRKHFETRLCDLNW